MHCFLTLQDKEGDSNVNMAMDKPDLFVLKPQREGGGNTEIISPLNVMSVCDMLNLQCSGFTYCC